MLECDLKMNFDKLRAKWELERAKRRAEAESRLRALEMKAPEVFRRFEIKRAIVFGSAAARASREASDIDLLVMPLEQSLYWEFRRELRDALGYEVDLYTQADDPSLVSNIVKRGEVIYDAEH
jgi:predicted nucleotidyltransferase